LRTVHDENARALRLEAGRADVALNLVSPTLLPALAHQPGLAIRSRPGATLTYVVPQEGRAPMSDTRVRRAISLSVDRQMLCATLFDGRAHPASGLIAPANWAHSEDGALSFDPAAARRLLDEAGLVGSRLTLLTSTERLRVDVARVIAQELDDVGFTVTVVPLELGTMLARLNAGDFDLAILTFDTSGNDGPQRPAALHAWGGLSPVGREPGARARRDVGRVARRGRPRGRPGKAPRDLRAPRDA
jgi:peptide/nickel transport system substrate-binding protein